MSSPSNSTKLSIPTQHERLSQAQVVDFAAWINGQLAELEEHFRDFMTVNSLRHGEGRNSHGTTVVDDGTLKSDEPPYSR